MKPPPSTSTAVHQRPLPRLRPPDAWRERPLEPRDEPLVPVDQLHERIRDVPRYHQNNVPGALERNWVRAEVGARLTRAADALDPRLTLIVWDGYRPLQTQAWLFRSYVDELILVHPEWPADALEEAAARYVTPPSRSRVAPPPHLTGGAIDVTLADQHGRPVALGTDFDAFGPDAAAAAYEDRSGEVQRNRRLLFWTMISVGFTAYNEEWWHFDYGDQFWSQITGNTAFYGPAEPPAG